MRLLREDCVQKTYDELSTLFSVDEWRKKYIVLFGRSVPTWVELGFFYQNNIIVQGIVDNDIKKQGTVYNGCEVKSAETLLGEYRENAYIVIASRAYKEIKAQLNAMGYKDSQIYNLRSRVIEPFPKEEGYEYEEMTLRDIQIESLNIMKFIKEFCDSRDIKYFLAYGSLLGAVRHKGFIPWDDDIDILVPWDDYVRFYKEFPQNDKYEIYYWHNKSDEQPVCPNTIIKVLSTYTITEKMEYPTHNRKSICVDVFPMNGYPNDESERNNYYKELNELYYEWLKVISKKSTQNDLDEKTYREYCDKLEKAMTKYNYKESDYVGSVACSPYNPCIAKRDMYEQPSKVLFEGEMFDAPNNADYILTETYGNYMDLPAEKDRNPRHFLNSYKLRKRDD